MNIGSYIQIRYDNGTTSHSPGWQGAHLLKGGEFANSREWQPMDELPMDASDEDLIDAADNLCREEGWPQDLEVRIDRPDPVRAAQSAAGVATTAKLGPEGIQARAKAGAAARWSKPRPCANCGDPAEHRYASKGMGHKMQWLCGSCLKRAGWRAGFFHRPQNRGSGW